MSAAQLIPKEIQNKLREQTTLIKQMRKYIIDHHGFCPFDDVATCSCGKKVEAQYLKKCMECPRIICGTCALLFCDKCQIYLCDSEKIMNLDLCECPSCRDKSEEIYRTQLDQARAKIRGCSECGYDEDPKLNSCETCDIRVCRFHVTNRARYTQCIACDIKRRYDKRGRYKDHKTRYLF